MHDIMRATKPWCRERLTARIRPTLYTREQASNVKSSDEFGNGCIPIHCDARWRLNVSDVVVSFPTL